MTQSTEPRIAVVLSGGGARGAYEAGILSYLLDDLASRLDRPVRFDVVTGTSVGAIHACFLAARQDEPNVGARLLDIWRSLSLEDVVRVGPIDLVRVPWRLLGLGRPQSPAARRGAGRLPGIVDTSGLEKLVVESVPWSHIHRNVAERRLVGLAVTATEIATGHTIAFVDDRTGNAEDWIGDPFVRGRSTRLGPMHALASAAIPLLFPAVRIGRSFYCVGGLRMNTPLAPALYLGADRVLVVGLRHPYSPNEEQILSGRRESDFMNPMYLAGKALNALLLDRVEYDLDRLRLINAILARGLEVYGPDFLEQINRPIVERRGRPYKVVKDLFLRPSADLGTIASECLAGSRGRGGLRGILSRRLAAYVSRGTSGEADLLSYLYFDRCYAERLIELGRADAAAAEEDLIDFFSLDGPREAEGAARRA
jgi:NTE family protein